jgi:hypothetical protein
MELVDFRLSAMHKLKRRTLNLNPTHVKIFNFFFVKLITDLSGITFYFYFDFTFIVATLLPLKISLESL